MKYEMKNHLDGKQQLAFNRFKYKNKKQLRPAFQHAKLNADLQPYVRQKQNNNKPKFRKYQPLQH